MINYYLTKIINGIYFFILCWIVLSVLLLSLFIPYYMTNSFPFPNIVYFIFDAVFVIAISYVYKKYSLLKKEKSSINYDKIVAFLAIFFLGVQIVLNYFRYFYYGWDAGLLYDSVLYELSDNIENINHIYFSAYKNNILLLYIYKYLGVIASFFNVELYIVLLIVNQIINYLTSLLVYYVTNMISDKEQSFVAFGIYLIFIGLSPWFIISYSDTTAIIFPLVIVGIQLKRKMIQNNFINKMLFVAIVVIAVVGTLIKPQVFIIIIAIIIYEIIKPFDRRNSKNIKLKIIERLAELLQYAIIICLVFGVAIFIQRSILIKDLKLDINSEYSFGPRHYVMMGLNDETDGAFLESDIDISISAFSKGERQIIEKNVIRERLLNYGLLGLMIHLIKKNMVNYCDGTFAWFGEGNFCVGIPEANVNEVNLYLLSWIIPGTSNYNVFLLLCQCFWILILVFMLCGAFTNVSKKSELLIFKLCIIGISLFELIFEARARYLFMYTPFYIILSSFGIRYLIKFIKRK